MTLAITIRTADRSTGDTKKGVPVGRRNYVGQTVRALVSQGVPASDVHLFVTDPDTSWLARELGDLAVCVHRPERRLTPNRNGIAQVSVLDEVRADWLVLLEDDLEFCQDFVGSVTRWLEVHASDQHAVYRLFSFRQPLKSMEGAYHYPLREMAGSQAVVLRAADARDLAAWHAAHLTNWRPSSAPYQKEYERGFDKLIGYWAIATRRQEVAVVARPFLVKHVGEQSSLRIRSWGEQNNHMFTGRPWLPACQAV